MVSLLVGEQELHRFRWRKNGTAVTTGSATALVFTTDPDTGALAYLQADLTTSSATPYSHTLTLSGGYWGLSFVFPASLVGRVATVKAAHSDATLPTRNLTYSLAPDLGDAGAEVGI